MPSTHTSLHYHLVFSTKERVPVISTDWRGRLHAYLGGIVKGLEGVPLAIGGIEDHVHLVVGLKSSHRLDYFLRDLKADSMMRPYSTLIDSGRGSGGRRVARRVTSGTRQGKQSAR